MLVMSELARLRRLIQPSRYGTAVVPGSACGHITPHVHGTAAFERSAILLDGSFDGTASPAEILRHHHRMNLDAGIEREEPRLSNRRDL